MVFEEAIELCVASGVPEDQIADYFARVLAKTMGQSAPVGVSAVLASVAEEAADTLSTVYALASTGGFSVHAVLDQKMAFNRSRPKSYYDAKSRAKGLD